ncbi:hypothetical protein CBM2637_U10033 [Cupriavidus taiwanensis]|nr:hypothetical protein CBM2637_U10033 [Cupriavidus taiwanensis]
MRQGDAADSEPGFPQRPFDGIEILCPAGRCEGRGKGRERAVAFAQPLLWQGMP